MEGHLPMQVSSPVEFEEARCAIYVWVPGDDGACALRDGGAQL